jgi:hypothetical protein
MRTSVRPIVLGLVATAILAIGLVVVALTVGRDRDTSNLGEDVFEVRAATVRRQTPLLVNDPLGGDRAIWITHVGTDDETGYHAFAAIDGDCVIALDRDTLELRNECTGEVVPPTGDGLPQYPVTVDGNDLQIDVNFAERPSTTTTGP